MGSSFPKTPPLGLLFPLFENFHFVDMDPSNIIPTWRNARKGVEGIEKRLNIFLILKFLLEGGFLIKPWEKSGGLFDLLLLFLRWKMMGGIVFTPKFQSCMGIFYSSILGVFYKEERSSLKGLETQI